MSSEFQHLFERRLESVLRELEARSQRRTLDKIQGVNFLDAWRAQNQVRGSARATVSASAGRT